MDNKLDFLSFLKSYFPEYKVDQHNAALIKNMSLWALRSPKFNELGGGWHIDKGWCLSGPVGTGKTSLLKMLNRYLNYIHSAYVFEGKVVWKYAELFKQDGYSCFNPVLLAGNLLFDELALVDENTGFPTRETVGHFGDKIIIGREIIMQMYNKFEETGRMAHFTTNTIFDDIESIYGGRAYSRLRYMCNFVTLTGEDRRMAVQPRFKKNLNQPEQPKPWQATVDAEKEGKESLEIEYQNFLQSGKIPEHGSIIYNTLVSFGVSVCSDEIMRELVEDAEKRYVPDVGISRVGETERLKRKQTFIWKQSREWALGIFFNTMKHGGATSIFGQVNVNLESFIANKLGTNSDQNQERSVAPEVE